MWSAARQHDDIARANLYRCAAVGANPVAGSRTHADQCAFGAGRPQCPRREEPETCRYGAFGLTCGKDPAQDVMRSGIHRWGRGIKGEGLGHGILAQCLWWPGRMSALVNFHNRRDEGRTSATGRKQPSADVQADGGASAFSIIGQGVLEGLKQAGYRRCAPAAWQQAATQHHSLLTTDDVETISCRMEKARRSVPSARCNAWSLEKQQAQRHSFAQSRSTSSESGNPS
ncbi:hypothetical protein C7414_103255 [Cupriavidus alkaliphilus]|nr:hypothetical protein C7414_103255 [Cupriavidus alkaliphilus]